MTATAGQPDGTILTGPNTPANGSPVGAFKNQIILIETTGGVDAGVWIDASDMLYFTIGFEGDGTVFSATLWGSNQADKPAAGGSGGIQIGTAITAAGFSSFTGPYRWLNLRLGTKPASGTIGAFLQSLTP